MTEGADALGRGEISPVEMTDLRGQMLRVLGVARSLSVVRDTRPLLELAAKAACDAAGYRRCWVALRNADGSYRYESAAPGSDDPSGRSTGHKISEKSFEEMTGAAVRIGGVLAVPSGPVLIVPLAGPDGTAVGFLELDEADRTEGLSTTEALVLETIGELVVAGLEVMGVRARGRTSAAVAEAQRRQLEALFGASLRVRGSLALEDVLTEIVSAMTSAGGFERAAVYLRDESDMLVVQATFGLTADEDAKLRSEPISLVEFSPLMRPEMLVSRSYLFDHRRFEIPAALDAKLVTPEVRQDYIEGRWHSEDTLTVPLVDQEGDLLGLITVDEPVDGLMPDRAHIQALEYFADQCAVAVDQARQYEAVQAEAATDPLTGLANRRALADAVHAAVERSVKEGSSCSLLFLDLDEFKRINDTLGHAAGDEVLKRVAQVLSDRLRRDDVLGRYGGEEFIALLPGTEVTDAVAIAEDLRGRVASMRAEPITGGIPVSVSIGVAAVSPQVTTADRLLKAADGALYDAKRAGRDRVRVAPA